MSSNSPTTNTTSNNNNNNTQVPEKPPIRWIKSMELSYEVPSEQQPSSTTASSSTATASASKATLQPQANSSSSCALLLSDSKKKEIRDTLWRSIRFYATPYSIFHSQTLGRGFCFIQSPNTIFQISLLPEVFRAVELQKLKKNHNKQKQEKDTKLSKDEEQMQMQIPSRNVLIHHMTLKEYDSELCMKADFELCSVREELIKAVNEHKRKEEMVLLMRFRCGHVALGVVNPPMQPDYKLALSLGRTYFGHDTSGQALQLNLDDM